MSSQGYSISKTSFLKFEQCEKAFFFYKNHPYLRDKLSVDKQLTFKRGHDVGYFAQQLFPGGVDVSKEAKNGAQAAELTAALISSKAPVIYEAAFLFNGVLIMVDILCLTEGKYLAYEVKSSIKISETYLKDAYLQYYVLKNSLPDFEDLFLVSLNPDYIREEEIDPKKLFRRRSVKQKAEENVPYFEHRIGSALQVLEQNAIPNIAIGKHCFRPYQCDYFGSCWKDAIHEKSIFNLPFIDRTRLFEWYNSGIKNIEQVSEELLKEDVSKIRKAFITKEPFIDHQKISAFLDRIKQPAVAMDLEVWSPAIPQLKGTRPFEQIPFLACFYDGSQSTHFFAGHQTDERPVFAEKLIELSCSYASVIVYDKTMEVLAIDSLIRQNAHLKEELELLKTKLVDVFEIFLSLAFYHPAFKSNFSLKVVSAVLLQDVAYSKITSGLEAMGYFESYRLAENEAEKKEIRDELISYCNMDAAATLKLTNFLRTLRA